MCSLSSYHSFFWANLHRDHFGDVNQPRQTYRPTNQSKKLKEANDAPPGHNRSSLSLGLDAIRYAGGVNSLDNFARSWTRAAGYFEIAPSRQPVVAVPGSSRDEESPEDSSAIDDDYEEYHSDATTTRGRGRIDGAASSFGSYGSFTSPLSRYGTMDSLPQTGLPIGRLGGAVRHVPEVQDLPASNIGVVPADKEREPLLVKAVVTEEGKVEHVIVGQSTLPQTVFNSVNVLIGIGLLSLPLGLRYSGWYVARCPEINSLAHS
jgi:vesicular inhibitory amino acid transporter